MKASDYIANFLAQHNIKVIFGYQGGMITHVIDSIGTHPNLQYIQCYHEQTAAIAAEGYSKATNNIGCAISSSGPGVTNMMTGIADAYFDSIPVLFITGQVNTYEYKYNKPIRQQGFQEMEVEQLVAPITKYSKMVDCVEDIPYELEKALYIACEGRKGPVLLDIPLNIQRSDINLENIHHYNSPKKQPSCNKLDTEVIHKIRFSKRPMILVGAGCMGAVEKDLLNNLLAISKIPVVTSLMGKGAIDETYTYYLGLVGSYGNRCANIAISQVDTLIVLGSRLDTRQTGAKIESFIPNATIIHVNNDKDELECNRIPNRIKINIDVSNFLNLILNEINEACCKNEWLNYIETIKKEYNQDNEIKRFIENKSPYKMMQNLNRILKEGDAITVDIGQNQMWASQTIKMKKNMRFMTSGGLAPMGFSMPAAIGIAFAYPHKRIFAICGDGGFHMSSQSLGIISQYKLKITIVLMNNECLGMINQFQRLYFDSRFYGTHPSCGYQTPDFEKMAQAYGIKYLQLTEETLNTLDNSIQYEEPLIIEYKIKGLTEVCPKLEYNKPIYQPNPQLEELELQSAIKFN